MDLSDFCIKKGIVEGYENIIKTELPKARLNLDKEALITLKNMKPTKNRTLDEYENHLRKLNKESGCEFILYDRQKFIWMFKVPGFW